MIFWIAGLLVLFSISPSLVSAQSAEQREEDALFGEAEQDAARAAFKDGRIAFDQGRYAEALQRFEHAYELSGKSELLYNIGLAADRIREDDRALEAFEQYLKETPASSQREQVRMRVVALREARARNERERSHEQREAPTPAEVASASVREPQRDAFTESDSDRDDGGVLSEWWFWAGASVLLIAGGVTAYVLLQPEDEPAELPRPNTGVIVPTLRLAP
jgi:tetratricopeptide (TPR) repeat protein